jgi:hypothetical protein
MSSVLDSFASQVILTSGPNTPLDPGGFRQEPGNGHGASSTRDNVSRCCDERFPHSGPLPVGEGVLERAMGAFRSSQSRRL